MALTNLHNLSVSERCSMEIMKINRKGFKNHK